MMDTQKVQVRVDGRGRFTIPITMRREMGLEKGGAVVFEAVDGIVAARPISVDESNPSSLLTVG